MKRIITGAMIASGLFFSSLLHADIVTDLQTGWGEANYVLKGDEQAQAFDKLLAAADTAKSQHPNDAGVFIWSGIINSSYAGVKGGLGALKYCKLARTDLEKSIDLDPQALNGSAYTSLGTLYYKVPGWPVGFGNDKKAQELLQQALKLNPEGIDSNYFYADYLFEQGDYEQALSYANKANIAPPRPFREIADAGRHKEINQLISSIEKKRH